MRDEAKKLKSKLDKWRAWMNDEDQHSISHQLSRMMWEDAVYRIINECRRLAPPAEEGGVELNGTVQGLSEGHLLLRGMMIAIGFVITVSLAVGGIVVAVIV